MNKSAKNIANALDLEDRIEKVQESESYITTKDHKDDFPHKIACRLIKTSMSDIVKISKLIIDQINTTLLELHKVNHGKTLNL